MCSAVIDICFWTHQPTFCGEPKSKNFMVLAFQSSVVIETIIFPVPSAFSQPLLGSSALPVDGELRVSVFNTPTKARGA